MSDATSAVSYSYGPLAMTSTAGTSTLSSTMDDAEAFLQILVAQLRYQDPMNPADTGELIQQQASMANLQAMQQMTTQSQQLLSSQLAFGSAALIGKEITYTDVNGNSASGTVTSVAFGTAGPILAVDGVAVAYTDILAINASAISSGSSDTSGSDDATDSDSTDSDSTDSTENA